jgi:hypothetical protein
MIEEEPIIKYKFKMVVEHLDELIEICSEYVN